MNPQLCQEFKASLKKIREQLEHLEGLCNPPMSILSLGTEMDTATTKPAPIQAKEEKEDEAKDSDEEEEDDEEEQEEEEEVEVPVKTVLPAPKLVSKATESSEKKKKVKEAPKSIRANKPKYSMADLVDPQKYKLMGNGSLSGMVWCKDENGNRTGKSRYLIFSGAKATAGASSPSPSTPTPKTTEVPSKATKKKKEKVKPEVQLFPSKIQNDHLNNLRAVHIGGS